MLENRKKTSLPWRKQLLQQASCWEERGFRFSSFFGEGMETTVRFQVVAFPKKVFLCQAIYPFEIELYNSKQAVNVKMDVLQIKRIVQQAD